MANRGDYDLAGDEPPAPNRRVPAGARGAAPMRGAGGARPGAAPGRVPTPMQSAAMLAAARRRPGSSGHERHATQQTMKLVALVVVAAVVLLAVVFGVRLLGDSEPAVGNDAEARKIISANSYQEARRWVTSGNDRFLMGHNPGQSEALIEEIYNLGAKQVLAGGGISSSRLIIELPEDAEARARLIDWRQRWAERYPQDYPRETDIGQKYLIINMPLNR